MATLKGSVSKFNDKRGFGFITPEKGGDEVFVHWEAIQTDDRWPKLAPGTKVQYKIEKDENGKTKAINVCKPGGGKLAYSAADTKEYGDFRYPGRVKFFRGRTGAEGGFGFIELTMEATVGGETLPEGTEIYVSREEILHENPVNPKIAKGMEVEFLVAKDGDKYLACEVTLPDGVPITEDAMPPREEKPAGAKGKGKGKGKGGSKGKGKGKGGGAPVQKQIQKPAPAPAKAPSKGQGKGGKSGKGGKPSAPQKGKGKGGKSKGKGKGR